MEVIRREEIPELRSVTVGSKEHNLGIVKDLRKHPKLDRFLPRDCEASMSWVHLDPGEELAVHTHPISSLLLCARGNARSIGDLEAPLQDGDIVMVRPGEKHGFVGGPAGMWAVSIQFEPRALYEDIRDPWVTFEFKDAGAGQDALSQRYRRQLEIFDTHRLFTNATLGRFDVASARDKLLDTMAVWSRHFGALTEAWQKRDRGEKRSPVAQQLAALLEAGGAASRKPIWDPFLEATAGWFTGRLERSNDAERAALYLLGAETATAIICARMGGWLAPNAGTSSPVEVDGLLAAAQRWLAGTDPRSAVAVLDETWSMLAALFGRVADMSVG